MNTTKVSTLLDVLLPGDQRPITYQLANPAQSI
jgi:hypothetical protein